MKSDHAVSATPGSRERGGPVGKWASIAVLIAAQIAVLSLWFSTAAVMPEIAREGRLGPGDLALLSTAVQIGFAAGALLYAALGLADHYDPRAVFMLSALAAAASNLALLAVPIDGWQAIGLRGVCGAAMAGVYPVGMKIAAGWGKAGRALLISLLIGALTLDSASPHLMAMLGGADWQRTIWISTLVAAAGAAAILAVRLGPWHARAPKLDIGAIGIAWTDCRIRLAILGYLGHMWELYAFWAWVGVVATASFALDGLDNAAGLGKLTAFVAIALGGLACVPAGWLAGRHGSARVALWCLVVSGTAALLSAGLFGGPSWLLIGILAVWGIAIIPDSALYSAIVASAAPPERAGSLLTLQTALGFLLTAVTVQGAPALAAMVGWPWVLAALAIGPGLGIGVMARLVRDRDAQP